MRKFADGITIGEVIGRSAMNKFLKETEEREGCTVDIGSVEEVMGIELDEVIINWLIDGGVVVVKEEMEK